VRREGSFDAEALPCATKRRLPEIALKHAIASCTVILLLSFAGGAPARTAEDATGSYVAKPFDARGITLLTYRYKTSDAPHNEAKNDDHPYRHKDIWIDRQTLTALYSFAYDRKGELRKSIWNNKRRSEDERLTGPWYPGWEGVEKARDLSIVIDMIVNVQTGTGNYIESWNRLGTPFKSRGKIRRFIDVDRLTKGL